MIRRLRQDLALVLAVSLATIDAALTGVYVWAFDKAEAGLDVLAGEEV